MISFLIGIITAAIVFYMSMIYGNAALALLGCFMCVFYGADIYSIACKGAPGGGSYKHSDSYRHTGREYQGESFLPAEGGRLLWCKIPCNGEK